MPASRASFTDGRTPMESSTRSAESVSPVFSHTFMEPFSLVNLSTPLPSQSPTPLSMR